MKTVFFGILVALGFVLASCGTQCPGGYNTTDPSCPGYAGYNYNGYQQPYPTTYPQGYQQPQPYYPGQPQQYYPGQSPPGYNPYYPPRR